MARFGCRIRYDLRVTGASTIVQAGVLVSEGERKGIGLVVVLARGLQSS
jgi:hypothetical protein